MSASHVETSQFGSTGQARPVGLVAVGSLARSAFLATGEVSQSVVRPEVARSWMRSRGAGFLGTGVDQAAGHRSTDDVTSLLAAFEHEMRGRAELMSELGVSAVLLDRDAMVIGRCGASETGRTLHVIREGHPGEIGTSMSESFIGTHAVNLSLHSGLLEQVTGAEHLDSRYQDTHSVAVPIFNSTAQRTLGILALEGGLPANPLLATWAGELSNVIRARMVECSVQPETLLMQDFLTARATARGPVVCLDRQTLVCNAAASRLLSDADQAVLWERASQFLKGEAPGTAVLRLTNTGSYRVTFGRVGDLAESAGVRITLQAVRERGYATRPRDSEATEWTSSIPGHSRRRARLIAEIGSALAASNRLFLLGEAGVGKLRIAQALLGHSARVIDCARRRDVLDDLHSWRCEERPLILTHPEYLSKSVSTAVESLVWDAQVLHRPLIMTISRNQDRAMSLHDVGTVDLPCVQVPSVLDRVEDLPHIVAALTGCRTPAGQEPVRWMPDALQLLARVDWPENIRSLDAVVQSVLCQRRTKYIDSSALPEGVRAQAAGRALSRLEKAEASEILASLRESEGNKLAAAQRLGIARSTLYRRMRALGVDLTAVNY